MPQPRLCLALALCAAVAAAGGLAGCVSRAQPKPSAAVLDLRAQARSARAAGAQSACPATDAPAAGDKIYVEFGFKEVILDDSAQRQLDDIAARLHCPGAAISLAVEDDHHGKDDQSALVAARRQAVTQYLATAGVAPAQYADRPGALAVVARGRDW